MRSFFIFSERDYFLFEDFLIIIFGAKTTFFSIETPEELSLMWSRKTCPAIFPIKTGVWSTELIGSSINWVKGSFEKPMTATSSSGIFIFCFFNSWHTPNAVESLAEKIASGMLLPFQSFFIASIPASIELTSCIDDVFFFYIEFIIN